MKLTLFFMIFCNKFCQAQNDINKEIEPKSDTLRKIDVYPISRDVKNLEILIKT